MVTAHRLEMPFRRGTVNAWLLPDAPATLVDCGPRTDEAWAALKAGLRGHGLAPGDVARVVVTHAHADHFGNAARLHALGAEVVASPPVAEALEGFDAAREARLEAHLRIFREAGMAEAALERLRVGHRYYGEISEAVPQVTPAPAGSAVEAGGGELRVLDAGGHAPGHVALHDAHGAQVLTGDALLERIATNAGDLQEDQGACLEAYLESLEALEDAVGAARVLPGHGAAFDDAAEVAEKHRSHVARRCERVRGIIAGGDGAGRSEAEVLDALYVGRPDPYLALSETRGYLQHLEREGQAASRLRGGVRVWRATGSAP